MRCLIYAVIFGSVGSAFASFVPDIRAFSTGDVRLDESTFAARTAALNKQYLLSLTVDSLLWTFRNNAGLPAPGTPFTGSWEDPGCEVRGQFLGHYLSATARLTGDDEVAQRRTFIVQELQKVQDHLGSGYLSAFPTEHFDRLQDLKPVWAPYYVIHKIMAGLLDQYTFAGNEIALRIVIDMAAYFSERVENTLKVNGTEHWHEMLNNEFGGMSEVLHNLYGVTRDKNHLRLAGLFVKPSFYEPLVALQDPLAGLHANTHLAQVNGFAAQYEKTGDKDALTAVQHFFDIITHHHSYATGGSNDGEFWGPADRVADAISQQQHALETEETCTQYNMLKIARYLFTWTGNVTYADYYERAITNGLLGTQRMPAAQQTAPQLSQGGQQHGRKSDSEDNSSKFPATATTQSVLQLPAHTGLEAVSRRHLQDSAPADTSAPLQALDSYSGNWRQAAFAQFGGAASQQLQDMPENAPGPGVLLYLLPLGAGQSKGQNSHGWGTPLHSFWCCYGSSVESFAKLTDSIYFYALNEKKEPGSAVADLYINQLVSSTLSWHQQGLTVQQTADLYGPNNTALTKLAFTVKSGGSDMLVVKLRIPGWVAEGTAEVRLNGQTWRECHHHSLSSPLQQEYVGTALSAGSYCSIKGNFKTGDVITAKLPMIVRAETVQDSRPEFQSLKAVLIGPMLMAGLTDGTRTIHANASDLTQHVSELSEDGLVSLKLQGSDNIYLQHQGKLVVADRLQSGNAAAMAATFRMVNISTRSGAALASDNYTQRVVLESMLYPDQIVAMHPQGQLVLRSMSNMSLEQLLSASVEAPLPLGEAPNDSMLSGTDGLNLQFDNSHHSASGALSTEVALHELGSESLWLVEPKKGQYPTGSKFLKGDQESFVISPISSIVDEQYTAYFQFETS